MSGNGNERFSRDLELASSHAIDPSPTIHPAGKPGPPHSSMRSLMLTLLVDLLESCRRHWVLLVTLGFLLAASGFWWGFHSHPVIVSVQLVRNETANLLQTPDARFKDLEARYSMQTLADIVRTPELLLRLGSMEKPPATVDALSGRMEVEVSEEPGVIHLRLHSMNSETGLQWIAALVQEAVAYAKGLQAQEAREMSMHLSDQLEVTEASLKSAGEALGRFQQANDPGVLDAGGTGWLKQYHTWEVQESTTRIEMETMDLRIKSLLVEIRKHHPTLLKARQELDQALLHYTDIHPTVLELKANVAQIESNLAKFGLEVDPEISLHGSSLAQNLYGEVIQLRTRRLALGAELDEVRKLKGQMKAKLAELPGNQAEYAMLKSTWDSLTLIRNQLNQRRQQAELVAADAPGYFRALQGAQVEDGGFRGKVWAGLTLGSIAGALGGLVACLGLALVDSFRGRIHTARDLRRVTGLPVMATLGDLDQMDDAAKAHWAFSTFSALKGKLTSSRHQSLVCGFVSSRHGEGRSTWVRMLADAAKKRGHRVLTICTDSCPPSSPSSGSSAPAFDSQAGSGDSQPDSGHDTHGGPFITIPSELTQSLITPHSLPIIHLQPLDWVWKVECREQWREAMRQCREVDNLVVLVDLPPVSEEECLLLSEDLSQVIWLCGQHQAHMNETKTHVEMLRCSRTGLVGAVMNHSPSKRTAAGRCSLFFALAALAFSLWSHVGFAQSNAAGQAAAPATPPAGNQTNLQFSVIGPAQMAQWQTQLTVGPGDVFDISLYQQPETLRTSQAIGPDGRLNYLQARDVMAAGLTIDQLRDELEKVLSRYIRPPFRVIIVPRAFLSKKYYVLGNVVRKGVFPLDRPMTVLESIAAAGGFVATPVARNTHMMADLSRSFLIRNNGGTNGFSRHNINFENLFLRGDLSQNIPLAPEDYLYFPPLDLPEVYVLGEVLRPGVVTYAPGTTLVKAIASQGGFTPNAFRQRVLVVRGSINAPERFVISVTKIIDAKAPDFKLEPRDIVYVSRKPWAFAEELTELAINEFLRAAVTAWTGENVNTIISEPIIK